MSNHLAHPDSPEGREKWIDDVESSQRNIVFPDTVRNARSADELLLKGSPNASLVQRIAMVLFGVTFFASGVAFIAIAQTRSDGWASTMFLIAT